MAPYADTFGQITRVANTTLNMPSTLPSATGYTTENAIPHATLPGGLTFSNPMCTAFPAGETNRLYVAQRAGVIRVVNNLGSSTPSQASFMDLAAYLTSLGQSLPAADENGLLSMVFHPNYQENGFFYLYFSVTISGQLHQRLARFQATGTPGNYRDASSANPATQAPLLTIYDQAVNHNGGDLAFGADGYLYLSLGDEGGGGDVYNNARFINRDFWGQMLRLDVDNRPGNLAPNTHSQPSSTSHPSAIHAGSYLVPADNPFIGFTSWHNLAITESSVRTEIYATGLRNPFRFTIDPPTQRIILGDVGQTLYEEIDLITKGGDYGWSWREGLHPYSSPPAPTTPPASGFNPVSPIFEYDHTNDGVGSDSVIYGSSVIGGMIYRGNRLTELSGDLIFCDVYGGSGIMAALRETSPGIWTGRRLLSTSQQIVDFGVDPRNGEPLLCALGGTIRRLVRSGTSGTPPPATLSATGAFSDLATMTPQSGILPFTPSVSFWSDHAIKTRWFSIPSLAATMGFREGSNWSFPPGQVWIKHFEIEMTRGDALSRRRLETRFLVKNSGGAYGITYKWRANQSDADLVAEDGQNETLTINVQGSPVNQVWRYPSRGECMTCHTSSGGFALGFNTRQLNGPQDYGAGGMANQIEALAAAGYFADTAGDVGQMPRLSPAHDPSHSLEWRARSYLEANCVQCHQPGGPALGSWDARTSTRTDLAGLINGVLVNSGGDDNRRVLVPGDPDLSMLLLRLQGSGGMPRMPPLGSNVVDAEGVQLVTDWINSLTNRLNFAQWQTVHFGSTSHPDAGSAQDPDLDGQCNSLEFLGESLPKQNASRWTWQAASNGADFQVFFYHPANRLCLIETSTNLLQWVRWNVPGNQVQYPLSASWRVLTGPADVNRRFFRAKLDQP